ncbi:MAG: xanthine dehydrogenase [Rhodospirillaceae bacterium]|jgi:CO/xanthine dehydrogenase FAD-binding subunit|nr:xanthine dehydrogenase [Rhodospirillaceae bacterium]|tara:strand:- start:49 stop:882 length:834 start_codon:yes stop_codon:yes gene_type:complete
MNLYIKPTTVQEALNALAENSLLVLAGGTDYYPSRVGRPLDDDILDISHIQGLRGISEKEDYFRIGALTRWSDLIEKDLPSYFDGLKLSAMEVGGKQIQNIGTITGNICNASPAADGIPPLLCLNAEVELKSLRGKHSMPLAKFLMGNRKTRRAIDEIVTGLRIPKLKYPADATFLKLGSRKYLVISIAMVSVIIEKHNGTIASARIAVGSCSAVAKRLHLLERTLLGQLILPGISKQITAQHLNQLSPIDDVRGTAEYRKDVALILIRRALEQLVS